MDGACLIAEKLIEAVNGEGLLKRAARSKRKISARHQIVPALDCTPGRVSSVLCPLINGHQFPGSPFIQGSAIAAAKACEVQKVDFSGRGGLKDYKYIKMRSAFPTKSWATPSI